MDDGLVVTNKPWQQNEALQPFLTAMNCFAVLVELTRWWRGCAGKRAMPAADRSWCDNHIVHAERDNSAFVVLASR